jgi:Uma2 family endonuclease
MLETEYLTRPDLRHLERVHGRVEVLAVPSIAHQRIMFFLARLLADFVEARGLGSVLPSGTRVRTRHGRYREPDVAVLTREHASREDDLYWDGADLVCEIVSPDDPTRDLVVKRREYAAAGIPEYWIVDPREERVLVLVLDEGSGRYREAGDQGRGETLRSVLLEGFAVEVGAIFDAARP